MTNIIACMTIIIDLEMPFSVSKIDRENQKGLQ
jgi:hypothetical protein